MADVLCGEVFAADFLKGMEPGKGSQGGEGRRAFPDDYMKDILGAEKK